MNDKEAAGRHGVARPIVRQSDTDTHIEILRTALMQRVAKHGPGAYAGPHETLGILVEEFDELRDAVRSNKGADVYAELLDIAVGAVFGMASLFETGHLRE